MRLVLFAKTEFDTSKREEADAKKCLDEIEKRWEVVNIDDDEDDNNNDVVDTEKESKKKKRSNDANMIYCAICRNSTNEPSIDYQANPSPKNKNGLAIAVGNCGHEFHLDCIQRWLKTRSNCPLLGFGNLCNEWDFAKIEWIPGYAAEQKEG